MRKGYYRTKRQKTIMYRILVSVVAIIIIMLLLDAKMRPLIRMLATSQASNLATVAINDAINEVMEENLVSYDNLVTIEYDDNGQVRSVKTDIIKINRLKAEISTRTSEKISKIQNRQISIPIGSLFGKELLSGRGPRIKLYINLSGNAQTQITNEFESAGINQTIHRIMLDIVADIYVVLPGANSSTQVKTSMCIAETVIVGTVPDTYATFDTNKKLTQK